MSKTPIDPKVAKAIKEYVEKAGRTEEYYLEKYYKYHTDEKALHPTLTPEVVTSRALFRLYAEVKEELRGTAVACDILVLATTERRDITAGAVREALTAFRENPEKALTDGIVDMHGKPLDTRATIGEGKPNDNYGKPITPVWVKTVFAIGKPVTEKENRFFVATIWHSADPARPGTPDATLVDFEENKSVRIRANVKGKMPAYTANIYRLIPSQIQPIPQIINAPILDLLRSAPTDLKISTLADLPAWHEAHKDDNKRAIILEGDVMMVNPEPTANGGYLIILEDEATMEINSEGTTVFMTKKPDFGKGSKVIVIGRTSPGQGFNRDTGQFDPAIKKVIVNAYSVYVDPQYRVPPEEVSGLTKAA